MGFQEGPEQKRLTKIQVLALIRTEHLKYPADLKMCCIESVGHWYFIVSNYCNVKTKTFEYIKSNSYRKPGMKQNL